MRPPGIPRPVEDASMEKVIYTTSTIDPLHLDQLKVLLWSLVKRGNDWPVCIDLVGCTVRGAEPLFEDLLKINKNVIPRRVIMYDECGGNAKDRGEISMNQLHAMYTRPFGVEDYLCPEQNNNFVCSIDTDIIVRGKLDRIWEGEWDLNLYFREKKRDHLKFQGGLIVYRNNEKVRAYYRAFLADLEKDKDEVYPCQLKMYKYALKHSIAIGKLPESYNDSELRKDSLVWHVKHSHLDKKRWRKEFKRLLKEANERIAA